MEGQSKVRILLFNDGLGEKSPPWRASGLFQDNGRGAWRWREGVFVFDTASSAILGGSACLSRLVGDNGVVYAEGRRDEFGYGKEGGAGEASYEASYPKKDMEGLEPLVSGQVEKA